MMLITCLELYISLLRREAAFSASPKDASLSLRRISSKIFFTNLFQGEALRVLRRPPSIMSFFFLRFPPSMSSFFLRLPPSIAMLFLRVRRVPAILFYLGNRKSTHWRLARGRYKSERSLAACSDNLLFGFLICLKINRSNSGAGHNNCLIWPATLQF